MCYIKPGGPKLIEIIYADIFKIKLKKKPEKNNEKGKYSPGNIKAHLQCEIIWHSHVPGLCEVGMSSKHYINNQHIM